MPNQNSYVKLTRVSDSAILNLPGPTSIQRDQAGNITFTWDDPIQGTQRLLASDLTGWASENVDVKRNRSTARQAITDPGGALVTVEWAEYDPWLGSVRILTLTGVVAVANARASATADGLAVIAYPCTYRYERGVGTLEVAP